MTKLTAERLGKHFGTRLLFRQLGFSVGGGEVLGITGANGSGKSTLIRILAGVMTPSAGMVTLSVSGAAVSPSEHPMRIGLVAPYLNLYDGLSLRENLVFIARARRLERAHEAIGEVLDLVELSSRADEPLETFSSGMKQRAKYAAACLHRPDVLLLDEPSANLDVAGHAIVARVIQSWVDRQLPVVVATNEAQEAARCHRVLSIHDFA